MLTNAPPGSFFFFFEFLHVIVSADFFEIFWLKKIVVMATTTKPFTPLGFWECKRRTVQSKNENLFCNRCIQRKPRLSSQKKRPKETMNHLTHLTPPAPKRKRNDKSSSQSRKKSKNKSQKNKVMNIFKIVYDWLFSHCRYSPLLWLSFLWWSFAFPFLLP